MPPDSRVSVYSLDDDDDYMGGCAAGLALSAWLGFVSYVDGTLHVSTKRIVFDPTDHSRPVHYFKVKEVRDAEVGASDLSAASAASVSFACSQYHVGPVGDSVGPLRRPEKLQEKWTFRLSGSAATAVRDALRAVLILSTADVLLRRCEAVLLQRGPRRFQSPVHGGAGGAGEGTASFPAWRVLPLRQERGVAHVSAAGITFDPLYPMLGGPLGPDVHLPAASIAYVFPRSVAFEATGVDVYTSAASDGSPSSTKEDSLALSLQLTSVKDREHALSYIHRATAIPMFSIAFADALRDWQGRRLSNYQYLQLLNKLASRTEQDLSQYPVFPWVLQDYTSRELHLEDAAVYRDLSRPIGALNAARLRELQERQAALEAVDEGAGERAGGHHLYSTHYSSAGAAAYFLVRSQPQYQLCLQHGRFDHPQRIFVSLAAAWAGVLGSASDYKELIPDLFDPPRAAALVRPAPFSLGLMDDGSEVARGVVLPPWADGSPRLFAQLHTAALESEYVSANLHHWIDLIFGYKQTGEEAVRVHNTFHPFSYPPPPGTEATGRAGGVGRVRAHYAREFGCTPTKLFSAPHPARTAGDGDHSCAALADALTTAARQLSRDSAAEEQHSVEAPTTPVATGVEDTVKPTLDTLSNRLPVDSGCFVSSEGYSVSEVASVSVMSAAAAAEVLRVWREGQGPPTTPPPTLLALSNLTSTTAGGSVDGEGSDSVTGETLLTAVCDVRRLTVCVFDCLSGERLRTFADFGSPIALLATHCDFVLIFTVSHDLFLLRLRTRAIVEHLESFSDAVPVCSASSGPYFSLVDGEGLVRVWHTAHPDHVVESLREEVPLVEWEAPAAVTHFTLENLYDGPLALATTADDELWWWRGVTGGTPGRAVGWQSCAIGSASAGSVLEPVLALGAFVGEGGAVIALVLQPDAVLMLSLSAGQLIGRHAAWPCQIPRFTGGLSLTAAHTLPLICIGSEGVSLLISHHPSTLSIVSCETLPWPPRSWASSILPIGPSCCSDGLVATLMHDGSVLVSYFEARA